MGIVLQRDVAALVRGVVQQSAQKAKDLGLSKRRRRHGVFELGGERVRFLMELAHRMVHLVIHVSDGVAGRETGSKRGPRKAQETPGAGGARPALIEDNDVGLDFE